MEYRDDTTHLVVKFIKKTKNGKECIDLVPVKWTFLDKDKFYCKYPDKHEYSKIDEMCKTSSEPGALWKSFEISIIKEARDYDQGFRRMSRAFSTAIVQSSNVDEQNSSEEEADPLNLSGNELDESLKCIPPFNGIKKIDTNSRERKGNVDFSSQSEVPDTEEEFVHNDIATVSSRSNRKRPLKQGNQHSAKYGEDTSTSGGSTPSSPAKKQKRLSLSKPLSNETNIRTLSSDEESARQKGSKSTNPLKKATKSKSQRNDHRKISMRKSTVDENVKKDQMTAKNKYCPTCGCAAKEAPASKSDIESARRSIEYRIKEEARIIRAEIAANSSSADIQKIMEDEIIFDLPKSDLESFLEFDQKLNTDVALVKKLKCFMVLNSKTTVKIPENLTAIIPGIMTKNVQIMYSAFGRETKGVKKLDFSKTQTYKYLLEVITGKFQDLNGKEFSSQLSRWFSGATDREGGKRDRLEKKRSTGATPESGGADTEVADKKLTKAYYI